MGHKKTLRVGITGMMASGKSEVCNYLKRAGYPVLFMDKVGHELLGEKHYIKRITSAFGPEILDKLGLIDRRKLSQIVFKDEEKLKILNLILHPEMNKRAKKWMKKEFEQGVKMVFIEAAILFEMQMDSFLDYIVHVKASEKTIVERVMSKSHKTKTEILGILKTQKIEEDKLDYVIINDGSLEALYSECNRLEKNLVGIVIKKNLT